MMVLNSDPLDVEDDSTPSVDKASSLCMVCEDAPKQYKCPRCEYFTCSLACCKQHKVEVRVFAEENIEL